MKPIPRDTPCWLVGLGGGLLARFEGRVVTVIGPMVTRHGWCMVTGNAVYADFHACTASWMPGDLGEAEVLIRRSNLKPMRDDQTGIEVLTYAARQARNEVERT